jgi:hypothetical protein
MWLLKSVTLVFFALSVLTLLAAARYQPPSPSDSPSPTLLQGLIDPRTAQDCWLTAHGTRVVALYALLLAAISVLSGVTVCGVARIRGSVFAVAAILTLLSLVAFGLLFGSAEWMPTANPRSTAGATRSFSADNSVEVVAGNASFCGLRLGLTFILWQVLVFSLALFHAVVAGTRYLSRRYVVLKPTDRCVTAPSGTCLVNFDAPVLPPKAKPRTGQAAATAKPTDLSQHLD